MKFPFSIFWACVLLNLPADAGEQTVSFSRDVRPILSENCFFCHGFDPATREADLRLDIREGALAAEAVVPGQPDKSELIRRIFSQDPDEIMPAPASHRTLTQEQKEILKRWVEQGAGYEPHWAWVPPPADVPLPQVTNPAWPRNGLDFFVLARLDQEGLQPSPEANRERWLRRVTFDLTGLPPTQAELDTFLNDGRPEAWEKVADRLLASPRFGERMAVPWLDLARYADSYGYQSDIDTRAWPYRDWVVRVLNDNLPWDQFITWQVAGDLLPDATSDQRLATAFNRIHRKTNEGGSIEEEMRQEGVSDRVHTFGTTFLALTMECCRCHDHKYDPLTAADYYGLGAFFNSIDEAGVMQYATGILPQPALPLPTKQQARELEELRMKMVREEQAMDQWATENGAAFQSWLAGPKEVVLPEAAAQISFESSQDGRFENPADPASPAASGGNLPAIGRKGQGVLLNGDDAVSLPSLGIQHAHDPMSFSLWLKPGENWPRAVILSNTASADTNYSGYELMWESGSLVWTVMREFPGNVISIRLPGPLPPDGWTHLVATYDGSMMASGLKLYINGKPAETVVERDSLTRDYRSGSGILLGARSRDFGLRGGIMDEVHVYRQAIPALVAAQLFDGRALPEMLGRTDWNPEEMAALRDYYFSTVDGSARQQAARVLDVRREWMVFYNKIPEIPVMQESTSPRPTFVLDRGAFDAPGQPVGRRVPDVLPPIPEGAPLNRLGLAQWLTDPRHPLTARVLMNRLWQALWGRGLVATADNFGVQGELPSHPELLDWLARDFIRSGWNYKMACRQIVLSAAYRQDSRAAKPLREKDPDNKLLARGPSRRLTAEMLRDSALALGGLLQPDLGGPPVYPVQPEGSMWNALNNFLPAYPTDTGPGRHRRSLYTFWRRTTTPPNMMALDATSRDVCAAGRTSTNTPLQPLVLMNDPQFVEAAVALGRRILTEGGKTPETFLAWGFREVSGRAVRPEELELVAALYKEQQAIFHAEPAKAATFIKSTGADMESGLSVVDWAAAASVASALFNLDASLMLR